MTISQQPCIHSSSCYPIAASGCQCLIIRDLGAHKGVHQYLLINNIYSVISVQYSRGDSRAGYTAAPLAAQLLHD